jgi:hypothetical protein
MNRLTFSALWVDLISAFRVERNKHSVIIKSIPDITQFVIIQLLYIIT